MANGQWSIVISPQRNGFAQKVALGHSSGGLAVKL